MYENENEPLKHRSAYLTDEQWKALGRWAKEQQTARSNILRDMIRERLENEGK